MLTQEFVDTMSSQAALLTALVASLVLFGGPSVSILVDLVRAAFPLPSGGSLLVAVGLSFLVVLGMYLAFPFDYTHPQTYGVCLFVWIGLVGVAAGFHQIKMSAARKRQTRKNAGAQAYPAPEGQD